MSAVERHPPIVETTPRAVVWHSEADTEAFACTLAAQPGLANCYIALHGDLGAGKTTFVRHLLRSLGVTGRIKSPTYAVVEPHDALLAGTPLPVWHFDFYRFNDPREWEDAGFRDIFGGPGLKLAEWPGNAAGLVPVADLAIKIEAMVDLTRHVLLQAGTAAGTGLLRGLAA